MAASLVQSMEISREEYDNIFGSSDEEMSNEDSDIDVSELEDESDENDESGSKSASGSESESDESVEWTDRLQNIHLEDFTSPVGITFEIGNEASELDVFKKLSNDEILNVIVRETNRYARQKLAGDVLDKWQDVTLEEIKAFLGVSVVMGVNILPSICDYWSINQFLGNEGIQKVMTKNRYENISRFFHFSDSSVEPRRGEDGYDRLYKVQPILSHFNAKIQEVYKPGKNISIDEGMKGFKGRLSFRQYMPAKPTKYGIKVWMAADASNGFVINHEVYLGKQRGRVLANGLGYSVVMELMNPFLNKNHHVYFDNFFSSPKLLEDLQNEGTYACSTVRAGVSFFIETHSHNKFQVL
ncbi:PREDICTED: piggyBac transposable element-derived protein 4-like [Acropora digitifera]|uniref:piggyBac transposable element-derived protein 4-like n=1 Tax=Acropora digitifera TaxID=70779 RepID=UPI00077A3D4F|nr:PREDICTED: piggyBac transposable element-derived protein 4-like [Acropora digitifera]